MRLVHDGTIYVPQFSFPWEPLYLEQQGERWIPLFLAHQSEPIGEICAQTHEVKLRDGAKLAHRQVVNLGQ